MAPQRKKHKSKKSKATKELARKLGILREAAENSTNVVEQVFSHLIVIDFESTCWESKENFKRTQEIIEFPAVLLNLSTGLIEDTFQQYVFPIEHSKLSSFCTNFTGITQETVDNGVPLPTCLNLFSKWMKKITDDENKKNFAFVTWSDWDLEICLENECKRKQIMKPEMFNEWIDLRSTFKNFYSRRPAGLRGALKDVGLNFQGRQHCGLDDATNTALLAWQMICDGCLLQITKIINSKKGATR